MMIRNRFLRRIQKPSFLFEAASLRVCIVSFSVRSHKIFVFADYALVKSPTFPVHYGFTPTLESASFVKNTTIRTKKRVHRGLNSITLTLGRFF